MAKSLPKMPTTPKTPSGGRLGPTQVNKTMPKVKLPKKGTTTYAERSTRDAGPK